MCSYCGCQALTVIRVLTVQHEEIINQLGQVRRVSKNGDFGVSKIHTDALAALLKVHNQLEEDGLFEALMSNEEFVETLGKLRLEHSQIDALVARLSAGDLSVVDELETLLRNNISNEENGLFPASALSLDGRVWDQIEVEQRIAL